LAKRGLRRGETNKELIRVIEQELGFEVSEKTLGRALNGE
jgi:hypothetical protein